MSGTAKSKRLLRLDGPPLIALALLALILLVAIWPTAPLHDGARMLASRQLRFVTRDNGSMLVIDADTGRLAGFIPSVADGFVPGVLHGVAVTRKRLGIDAGVPYRVTEMSDGRALLSDPTTHIEIDLESFGFANAGRFVAFLHSNEEPVP